MNGRTPGLSEKKTHQLYSTNSNLNNQLTKHLLMTKTHTNLTGFDNE